MYTHTISLEASRLNDFLQSPVLLGPLANPPFFLLNNGALSRLFIALAIHSPIFLRI